MSQHYGLLLGLSEPWRVESVDLALEARRVEVVVAWAGGRLVPCPECGAECPLYDLREERRWRHLDTMQFETIIRCRVPRCHCPEHGIHTIKTPWADKHGRFTLLFEAFAVLVLQSCDNVEAARKLLKLNWEQVATIRKRAVERGLERRGQEPVERLGLDEKSFGKRHDYLSVMTDLDRGCVLEVTRERKQQAAEDLLLTLSEVQRGGVLAVAMDMWPAFMKAARKHLPEAVLVHDKFHVAKHLGEAVDNVRKQEHRALIQQGDSRLKGAKFLVLKNPDNLNEGQRERFEALRDSNLKTARAWAIKEQFKEFWQHDFVADARACFNQWYRWAIRSRLKPIKRKARMLKKHLDGLLGYALHPVTNAVTEGLNSKIQHLKASARGFRSFQHYRLAILFHCGKLNLLPEVAQALLPQKS